MYLSFGLGLSGRLLSLVVWSAVPNPMPIHWDAAGQANGFVPRSIGLTMIPVMDLGICGFIAWLARRLDKEKARKALARVVALSSWFMLMMHGLVVNAALRPDYSLSIGLLMVLMGAFFAAIGALMPGIEQNKWIGVRTPWTLSNEANWAITHRFAGYTMIGAGVLTALVGLLPIAPAVAFWVGFTAIMLGSLAPVALSYAIHRTRK